MRRSFGRARGQIDSLEKGGGEAAGDFLGFLRRYRLQIIFFLFYLVISLFLFPPTERLRVIRFSEGDVADTDILAPFTFTVPLPSHEVELELAKAALEVPPVFVKEDAATEHLPEDLKKLSEKIQKIAASDLSTREKMVKIKEAAPEIAGEAVELLLDSSTRNRLFQEVERLQRQLIERGIVNDWSPLRRRSYNRVAVISGGEESQLETDRLVDQQRLGSIINAEARKIFGGDERAVRLFHSIARAHLTANMIYDASETQKRREDAMRKVTKSFTVPRGTRIVARHDRITASQIAILEAMERKRAADDFASSLRGKFKLFFGKGVRISALLVLLGLALFRFERRMVEEHGLCTLGFIILSIHLLLTALVMRSHSLDPYLVPTAFVSLLATEFFGVHAALMLTVFASLMLATHTALPASYSFVSLLAGAAAILSIAKLRERKHFYNIFLSISVAYLLGIASFGMTEGISLVAFARSGAFAIGNALFCTVAVMFLMPIFESLFDIATSFTLMELSDLNRPILRRLIMEAPGTYHHSLMVGNLVEAVSREAGANGLLARVGAYYHDIGKLSKPEYFFENTGGRENKHEKLSPRMSALILASHVKEGVELARSEKLPRAVIDAIREHHGRTVMAYFYQKALEYDSRDSVNVEDFRYPGPRPSSKETALIMLADSCEAAVRSLKDPTAAKIRAVVQKIVNMRLSDGELDGSGLTLNDIALVRERFVQLLTSVFHPRIAYPAQETGEAGSLGESDQ